MTAPSEPEQIIQVSNMSVDIPFIINIGDVNKTIEKVQLYDRSAMNLMWNIRDKLFSARDATSISMLKKFYDNRKKASVLGKRPATYKLSSNSTPGKLGFGRYYGGDGSLETLETDIRATLCHNLYYDIDIVNCHPTIIVQLGDIFNLDMPVLRDYVMNRGAFFNKMRSEYAMDESQVKNKIITIIYGAKLKRTDDVANEFREIKKETERLIIKLVQLAETNPYYSKLNDLHKYLVKQDDNVRGKFLCYIIQTLERNCLEVLLDKGEELGLQVDTLAYDGFMPRKEVDGVKVEITNDILDQLCDAVNKKLGWVLELKEKPMIPMNLEEFASTYVSEYDQMKAQFEEEHFYFKPTDTVVEITDEGLIHYNLGHSLNAFNTNQWKLDVSTADGKKISFIKKWLGDPARRIIDKLVYKMPSDCAPNEVSLFMGFKYEKLEATYDEKAVTFFKDLLSACCNDESVVIEYITKTFAHMIKKPFEKTGVCCIFSSHRQGCGKDTLLNWIGSVLGRYCVAHYTDTNQFWEKHDTGLEGSILCHLEEACAGANKANSDKLKARITADDLMVNPKGLKAYYIENISRFFMTTNHADPVKVEETDRRFFLINPSERLAVIDWTYYQKMIRTNDWIYSIGKYLENIDVEEWNPRVFPITEIKRFIQEESKTSEARFLEIWNDNTPDEDSNLTMREEKGWESQNLTGATLYNYYKNYCQENSLPFLHSSMSFVKKISAYKDKLFVSEFNKNKKMNLYSLKQ